MRLGRARSRPGDAWKWAGVGERLGQRAGLAWEKGLGWVLGFGLLWVWVLFWVFYFYFFLFLVLIQTKLFEFKQNLNSTPMHSNKKKSHAPA